MPIKIITYSVEWKPAGTWVAIANANIINVSGEGGGAGADGSVGFADASSLSCTIQVKRTAVAGQPWARTPIRATFTVDGVSAKAFVGTIQSWHGDLDTVEFGCISMLEDMPARTRDLYSQAFFRRPVATETTVSSTENPAAGGYAAGLINWLLWQAGGRPNEQAGSYPAADFYYTCDQAILAPDWSWIAGENGYEEARKLVRCAGGQLYQSADGVIAYKQPLAIVGTPTYTFTASVYGDISEEGSADALAASVTCSFTPRSLRVRQTVIDDDTPRVVAGSGSLTIDLEPRWPCRSGSYVTPTTDQFKATFFDGRAVGAGAGGYTLTLTTYAQRVTIAITNNSSLPFIVNRIKIDAEPITAGEQGMVTVGSGQPTRTLEDNIYVQNKNHAERLAGMALAFFGSVRNVRTLSGCPYDVARLVDETVNLSSAELGLASAPHLITAIRHSDTGAAAEYTLVDTAGLPQTADYWLVKSASQSGTKKLGW